MLDVNALALAFHFHFQMPAVEARQLAIVIVDHYQTVFERVEAKGLALA
jgi:hypothetical protein